jgi:hypothetical protein
MWYSVFVDESKFSCARLAIIVSALADQKPAWARARLD